MIFQLIAQATEPIFGGIDNPYQRINPGATQYGELSSGGLINFMSNGIKLMIVVAGIYSFFNFAIAGFNFATSEGDPKKVEFAMEKIKYSVVGIVVVVASFLFAGILGAVIFGRYDAILAPELYGPVLVGTE